MHILQSIVLGIVEGITEFLPISSTFHLIWTSRLLGLPSTEFVNLFTVFIQAGAILAVITLFAKEVLTNRTLFLKLIVSFIPTASVAFVLYDVIKSVFFEQILFTTIVFIGVGGVFLIIEHLISKKILTPTFNIENLSWKHAILVGFFQALAIVPGVSRAGAVLVGMMILGYKRSESAKYSFMLSVPTILAASIFDAIEMRDVLFTNIDLVWLLAGGFVTALLSALFCVSWLIKYLQSHSLAIFGWYRILLGILLILFLILSP